MFPWNWFHGNIECTLEDACGKIRQIAELFRSVSGSYKSTFLGKTSAFPLKCSSVRVELNSDEPVQQIARRSGNFSAQCPIFHKEIYSKKLIRFRNFLWTRRGQFWQHWSIFFHKKLELVSLNVHKGYVFPENVSFKLIPMKRGMQFWQLWRKRFIKAETCRTMSQSFKSTFLGKSYAFPHKFSYVRVELSFDEPVQKNARRSGIFSRQCPKLRKNFFEKIDSPKVVPMDT